MKQQNGGSDWTDCGVARPGKGVSDALTFLVRLASTKVYLDELGTLERSRWSLFLVVDLNILDL